MAAFLFVALTGAALQVLVFRRMQGDDLRQTLVTVGISIVAADLMLAVWSGTTYQFSPPEWLFGATELPVITAIRSSGAEVYLKYPTYRIFVLAVAIVVGILLWLFLNRKIMTTGCVVQTVDLSATGTASSADVTPQDVAACHPEGVDAVFTGGRGTAVAGMADAFCAWVDQHGHGVGGMISAGGAGGTALVTPAMQVLPIGVPKVMVSTVASGNVEAYVGPSDIMMMYSVTDVQGLNAISRKVLGNAAAAVAGMAGTHPPLGTKSRGLA